MAICTYCKKEFIPKKSSTGKYCSKECCKLDRAKNGFAAKKKEIPIVSCSTCGKLFRPSTMKQATNEIHCCSRKCQYRSMRKTPQEYAICPTCGKQFVITSKRTQYCNRKCSNAAKRQYESESERKKASKARWRDRHKPEREARAAVRAAAKEAERNERKRLKAEVKQSQKLHECVVCGAMTIRPKYCSDKCCRKAENRRRDINRRHKLRENGAVDHSISLERLIQRDKNICHICGGKCDITDCQTVNGIFIVGNMYPSIDHVVAVANGGKHQWDNIKLAHMICNSTKNAAVLHDVAGGQLKLWV